MAVDPGDLTAMGQTVRVRADAVAALRERLAQAIGRASWSGSGATRFRFNAELISRALAADADDLRTLAVSFERLAEALREELAALKRIEVRVRGWFLVNPSAPAPWPPSALPLSGEPQWREVQRAFVAAGIDLEAVAAGAVATPAGSLERTGDWKATLSPAEYFILEHESGLDPTARNADSGAFGIWQGLGPTLDSYASRFGFDKHTTDPHQQLTMFRAYIKDRYGTAEKAMDFWQKHKWY